MSVSVVAFVVIAVAGEATRSTTRRFSWIHLSFTATRTPTATDTGHYEKV
jgi:hypothetical protein